MYKKNEKLELLSDYKKKGEVGYIPKGTIVYFQDVKDVDLKSLVQIRHDNQILIVPELAVRPLETNPEKVLKQWSTKIISERKDLGIYHPNFFIRTWYKFLNLFKKKEVPKKDLSRIKNMLKDDLE